MRSSQHPLTSMDKVIELMTSVPDGQGAIREKAVAHSARLTKPPGSLGRLEEIAFWYANWSRAGVGIPKRRKIIVFAGNHGVADLGVSAFPSEVTAQMVQNFHHGGAAINQLAREMSAQLEIVELSLDRPTRDFTRDAALSETEFLAAMQAGWDSIDPKDELVAIGEMGIANTCSAAAVASLLYGGGASRWTGAGTGVSHDGLAVKIEVVRMATRLHRNLCDGPLDVLRRVGGREIAAMAGAILHTRILPTPLLLDGYVCSAAAAALDCQNPRSLEHAMAAHLSAEAAHRSLLKRIRKRPLLDLGMRLGEGSGAALAMFLVNCAMACHVGMATFEEASVSDRS